MAFAQKKVGDPNYQKGFQQKIKETFSLPNIIKGTVLIVCILFVIYFGNRLLIGAEFLVGSFTKNTGETLSKKFGQEMKRDELGNVNIMLLGYGGADHAGGYLADSIIIASRNPELGAVTMLSVPRDLYIHDEKTRWNGKINSLFAHAMAISKYTGSSENPDEIISWRMNNAAKIFVSKLEEITGKEIPYYAIVNFEEFEQLIDHLGGLDIFVEKRIYDTAYPGPNNTYETFSVEKGINHFDGATALKYARSRHSTSDFDRSSRQQQIIKAVSDKLLSKENLTSMKKINQLYEDYTQVVNTNINLQEMIGMFQYASDLDHIFSFVLTTNYSYKSIEYMEAGCFLYVPDRDVFGGSSVLLPEGATPGKISFYEYIQHFVFLINYHQKFLIENPRITMQNGIDKAFAKTLKKDASGHALKMGVKLKKFAFNIVGSENAEIPHEQTSFYVNSGISYENTLEVLRLFLQINRVFTGQNLGTGTDIVLVIGNDYLEKTIDQPFSYNK